MRLHLEADPDELATKGDALVDHLAKALRPYAPHLADVLEKAITLPPKQKELRHQTLRDFHAKMKREYGKTVERILVEVNQAIDDDVSGKITKSSPDYIAPLIEKEEKALVRIKSLLSAYGYAKSDFEEGGKLYGKSINELRDLYRDLKDDK